MKQMGNKDFKLLKMRPFLEFVVPRMAAIIHESFINRPGEMVSSIPRGARLTSTMVANALAIIESMARQIIEVTDLDALEQPELDAALQRFCFNTATAEVAFNVLGCDAGRTAPLDRVAAAMATLRSATPTQQAVAAAECAVRVAGPPVTPASPLRDEEAVSLLMKLAETPPIATEKVNAAGVVHTLDACEVPFHRRRRNVMMSPVALDRAIALGDDASIKADPTVRTSSEAVDSAKTLGGSTTVKVEGADVVNARARPANRKRHGVFRREVRMLHANFGRVVSGGRGRRRRMTPAQQMINRDLAIKTRVLVPSLCSTILARVKKYRMICDICAQTETAWSPPHADINGEGTDTDFCNTCVVVAIDAQAQLESAQAKSAAAPKKRKAARPATVIADKSTKKRNTGAAKTNVAGTSGALDEGIGATTTTNRKLSTGVDSNMSMFEIPSGSDSDFDSEFLRKHTEATAASSPRKCIDTTAANVWVVKGDVEAAIGTHSEHSSRQELTQVRAQLFMAARQGKVGSDAVQLTLDQTIRVGQDHLHCVQRYARGTVPSHLTISAADRDEDLYICDCAYHRENAMDCKHIVVTKHVHGAFDLRDLKRTVDGPRKRGRPNHLPSNALRQFSNVNGVNLQRMPNTIYGQAVRRSLTAAGALACPCCAASDAVRIEGYITEEVKTIIAKNADSLDAVCVLWRAVYPAASGAPAAPARSEWLNEQQAMLSIGWRNVEMQGDATTKSRRLARLMCDSAQSDRDTVPSSSPVTAATPSRRETSPNAAMGSCDGSPPNSDGAHVADSTMLESPFHAGGFPYFAILDGSPPGIALDADINEPQGDASFEPTTHTGLMSSPTKPCRLAANRFLNLEVIDVMVQRMQAAQRAAGAPRYNRQVVVLSGTVMQWLWSPGMDWSNPQQFVSSHAALRSLQGSSFGGDDVLVLPYCRNAHFALIVVRMKTRELIHYDSLPHQAVLPGDVTAAVTARPLWRADAGGVPCLHAPHTVRALAAMQHARQLLTLIDDASPSPIFGAMTPVYADRVDNVFQRDSWRCGYYVVTHIGAIIFGTSRASLDDAAVGSHDTEDVELWGRRYVVVTLARPHLLSQRLTLNQ